MGGSVVTVHNGVAIIVTGWKNKEPRAAAFVCQEEGKRQSKFTGQKTKTKRKKKCQGEMERTTEDAFPEVKKIWTNIFPVLKGSHFGEMVTEANTKPSDP